jgi:hypothetical protein
MKDGRGRSLCAAFAAVLLLAGCVTPADPQQAAAPATVQQQAMAGDSNVQLAAIPPAPPPAPKAHPAQLLGLQPSALTALLGEPQLRRVDPPAQVWLYTNSRCAFHVYLYPHDDNTYRVTHYDLVPRQFGASADPGCYRLLLVEARQRARSS